MVCVATKNMTSISSAYERAFEEPTRQIIDMVTLERFGNSLVKAEILSFIEVRVVEEAFQQLTSPAECQQSAEDPTGEPRNDPGRGKNAGVFGCYRTSDGSYHYPLSEIRGSWFSYLVNGTSAQSSRCARTDMLYN